METPPLFMFVQVNKRCNLRCQYCMPRSVFGQDYRFMDRAELLTFEEIVRMARLFAAEGVEKLRITGGEPLVRRDLPALIAMLAEVRRIDGGPVDLTLTTNGSALRSLAGPLRSASRQARPRPTTDPPAHQVDSEGGRGFVGGGGTR